MNVDRDPSLEAAAHRARDRQGVGGQRRGRREQGRRRRKIRYWGWRAWGRNWQWRERWGWDGEAIEQTSWLGVPRPPAKGHRMQTEGRGQAQATHQRTAGKVGFRWKEGPARAGQGLEKIVEWRVDQEDALQEEAAYSQATQIVSVARARFGPDVQSVRVDGGVRPAPVE